MLFHKVLMLELSFFLDSIKGTVGDHYFGLQCVRKSSSYKDDHFLSVNCLGFDVKAN